MPLPCSGKTKTPATKQRAGSLTDDALPSGYFEAAEEFADISLLPAVLYGEKLWREGLDEGKEISVYLTSAVETLTRLAEAGKYQ